ncbi:MAG TPA: GNAT family N-acetyltransferase [Candidatus Dormibacteraeota bacterium]
MRRLGPDEWQAFRVVRLAALKDAPYAFGSTYEAEVNRTEERWRSALADRTRFVAESEGEVIGTVGAGPSDVTGTAALTALWVAPAARGRGVGEALVNTVLGWAKDAGYERVMLWVVEGNSSAESLYRRTGFRRTGSVQMVRPGDPRIEYEMSLTL